MFECKFVAVIVYEKCFFGCCFSAGDIGSHMVVKVSLDFDHVCWVLNDLVILWLCGSFFGYVWRV